jgi:hypothetical protein
MKQLVVTAQWEQDELVICVENTEVRRITPKSHTPYTFKYNKEEFNFIYEPQHSRDVVFFYPINVFKERRITLPKNEFNE